MKLRFLSIPIALSLIISVAACNGQKDERKSAQVQSAKAQQGSDVGFIDIEPVRVHRTNEVPGRVVSYQVAEIRPQVSGIIQSRLFEEGSYVEEGQKLYQIDPARYEANYQIANANLKIAKVRSKNAQTLVNRYKGLIKSNAVSRQVYDDAVASLDEERAAVSLAEAELKSARINLDYTRVNAPISGYISPSNVTRGALVTAQQELSLATIRQLDPVYVDLSKGAGEVRDLQQRLAASRLNKESKSEYEVSLYLGSTGQPYPLKGTLDATDLAVDTQTGSIRLRSVFANPDNVLLPGMFVRASIEDIGRSRQIVIPQKSVKIDAGGNKYVWTVSADNKAVKKPIRTGAAYESNWIVLDGLEAGDRLIVEGTMMLREGAPLKPEKINTGQSDKDNSTVGEQNAAVKARLNVSASTQGNRTAVFKA